MRKRVYIAVALCPLFCAGATNAAFGSGYTNINHQIAEPVTGAVAIRVVDGI